MTTTPVRTGRPTRAETHRRRGVALQRASGNVSRRQAPPEFLEASAVKALIECGPTLQARLVMLEQWRAGLRISEAIALEGRDLYLEGDTPMLRVRRGKGNKGRLVEMHLELKAALVNARTYGSAPEKGRLVETTRQTALEWVKRAQKTAEGRDLIPKGLKIGTHTLRHSAARHWLSNGVPINVVSRWLGHASLQTTLVYLTITPDPVGYMERVP